VWGAQWGAGAVTDQMEYASLHMHARIRGLSEQEQRERDAEDDEYTHEAERRVIFLRDGGSGEEVPLTQGEYRPPSRQALYGNVTATLSQADVDALVVAAQEREAQGQTQAVLQRRLAQMLRLEKSRRLADGAWTADGCRHADLEGTQAELGRVVLQLLYLRARDLLAQSMRCFAEPGEQGRPSTAGEGAPQAAPAVSGAAGLPGASSRQEAAANHVQGADSEAGEAQVDESEDDEEGEAQVDESEDDEAVLVQWAASIGDVRSLRILLQHNGVRLRLSGPGGGAGKSEHQAAEAGRSASSLGGGDGLSPVHWAALYGHTGTVRYLVNKCGLSPNARESKMGLSPLHLAANNGHVR
jgi:hypothetical protein